MLTVGMHLPLRDRRLAWPPREGRAAGGDGRACSRCPAGLLAASIAGGGPRGDLRRRARLGLRRRAAARGRGDGHRRRRGADGDGAGDDRRHDHDPRRCRSCCSPGASGTWCSAACSWRRCRARCSLLGAAAAPAREWVHACGGCPSTVSWALDLRLSLLVLFLLAWIAQKGGTSILIAGFGGGRDGGADRRAQTSLDADARHRGRLLRAAVLRRARRAAGPGGARRRSPRCSRSRARSRR